MRREHSYDRRHGRTFPSKEVTKEEKLAAGFVCKIKEEALTIGEAEEVLDIARGMIKECKIV